MARRVKWFTTPSLAMEGEEDKEVEGEEGEKKKEGCIKFYLVRMSKYKQRLGEVREGRRWKRMGW